MFCVHCGTEFEGNFCPKCGQPAGQSAAPQPTNGHRYYDKEGDLIDLEVVYGAYKDRKKIIGFFQRFTNYPIEEIGTIVDYMESHVSPREYTTFQAISMRDQIESPFKRAETKEHAKQAWSDLINQPAPQSKRDRIKENKQNGVACCPKCGSTSLSANKKGFGIGKAVIGAGLTANPIGLIAGNLGAKKVWVTCLNCGHRWKM